MHGLELVLAERLGREEQQRGGVGVVQQHLNGGGLIAERLPGRCAGDDKQVSPTAREVDRPRLVRVESLDAPTAERPPQRRRQWCGRVGVLCLAFGHLADVDDLLAVVAG